jgi:hypothetical protein
MKYTVFYKPDGTVIAIAPEQVDIETIKIGTFEIPDGNVIDSIDTSKKEHMAVSHITAMTNAAELADVKKQTKINSASIAELADLFMRNA